MIIKVDREEVIVAYLKVRSCYSLARNKGHRN
jgi:hypothetical protein